MGFFSSLNSSVFDSLNYKSSTRSEINDFLEKLKQDIEKEKSEDRKQAEKFKSAKQNYKR